MTARCSAPRSMPTWSPMTPRPGKRFGSTKPSQTREIIGAFPTGPVMRKTRHASYLARVTDASLHWTQQAASRSRVSGITESSICGMVSRTVFPKLFIRSVHRQPSTGIWQSLGHLLRSWGATDRAVTRAPSMYEPESWCGHFIRYLGRANPDTRVGEPTAGRIARVQANGASRRSIQSWD